MNNKIQLIDTHADHTKDHMVLDNIEKLITIKAHSPHTQRAPLLPEWGSFPLSHSPTKGLFLISSPQ